MILSPPIIKIFPSLIFFLICDSASLIPWSISFKSEHFTLSWKNLTFFTPSLLGLLISTLTTLLKMFSWKSPPTSCYQNNSSFHSSTSSPSVFDVVCFSILLKFTSFHWDAWKGRMSVTKGLRFYSLSQNSLLVAINSLKVYFIL